MASQAVAISPPDTSSARVPELDGIRGIAILLVLATHFGYPAAGPGLLRNILSLGWVGVDLFFVLSGYLITGILLNTKGRANYFQRFYLRRLFRILPIYYAFLILIFHVVPLLGHPVAGAGEAWYWLYLANWRNGSSRYLQHFWSLAIEEQFYLGWPLLVHLCSRRSLKLVCVSIVLLSPLARFLAFQMGVPPFTVYEVTPLRLDGLALGALLALANGSELRRAVRWVPAACAAAVLALLSVIAWSGASHVSQPMAVCGYSCITVLSAALVLKGGLDGGARLLTSSWLGSFGRYSYGIYVWHALIWIKSASLLRQYRSAFPAWVLVPVAILGGVAASWVIARVSWYLIESPCAKVKERYFKTAEPNGDVHR